MFEIYIDELEAFLSDSSFLDDGHHLHQVLISILIFAEDVVLLASSPEGLQRILDRLASFCDMRQLVVNLEKTRVMVFNGLKTSHLHFHFQVWEVEITSFYTYLGVKFFRSHFNLRSVIQPRINKGLGSLAMLERQCFRYHF